MEKLIGWYPKQTNAVELYNQHGKEWSKIDTSKLAAKEKFTDDWVNMPKEAIEYLKSLEEFDAEIFKEITGLDSDGEIELTLEEVAEKFDVDPKRLKIKS
jgi:DNA-directed RNA polymerase sigma subunit (sigma70/sigma32)